MKKMDPSRRNVLSLGAGLAALSACNSAKQETPSLIGAPLSKHGSRSPHDTSARLLPPADSKTPSTGSSRTPLQDSYGIITPSGLHFERHHSGVPDIDPATPRAADPWPGGAAAGLQAGRPEAVPIGIAHPFRRMLGQRPQRIFRQSRRRSAAEPRSGELQRVDRRSGEALAGRGQSKARGQVGDRRGRRRVPADAQHPDREAAR